MFWFYRCTRTKQLAEKQLIFNFSRQVPPPFHGSANDILQSISINLATGFRHKLRKINGAYNEDGRRHLFYNEDGRRHLSYIQDMFYKSHDVYIESRVMCQDNLFTCIIFPILQYRGTLHMYFTFIYLTILLKAGSNHNEQTIVYEEREDQEIFITGMDYPEISPFSNFQVTIVV